MSEFSYEAARSYLQTAVFVDDRIYEGGLGKVIPTASLQNPASSRKPALASAAVPASAVLAITDSVANDAKEHFSAQAIVVSFAREGIVCALYQPADDSNLDGTSDACQLCLSADIVLVDWDLHGDRGKRARCLVGALIQRSIKDIPGQLRLVVVYTGEPNLALVLDEIFGHLSELPGERVELARDVSGLALHTVNSRIVVLGKPGLAQITPECVVKECDLAERAILEYSLLASGLLQGAVLHALGEIRHNTHRILTRFDAKLDPAYLTHRVLSLPHDDAFDHVLPLVMSEVQAVLEDKLPPDYLFSDETLADWVSTQWKLPNPLPEILAGEVDPNAMIRKLLLAGPAVRKDFEAKWKDVAELKIDKYEWKRGRKSSERVGICILGAAPSSAHDSFAVLASLRTHYESATRTLHLGTILSGPDDKYFICLLPDCDCVRLNEAQKFLLIEIEPVNGGDRNFNVVVEEGTTFRRFLLSPKVFRSHVETFTPDSSLNVVKAEASGSKWIFRSTVANHEYFWLGQLKPDHAQRFAAKFAAALARVGVTESEWLRRMGPQDSPY